MQIKAIRPDSLEVTPTLSSQAPLQDAFTAMLQTQATAVMIVDNDEVRGILTRGDLLKDLNRTVMEGIPARTVKQMMSSKLITVCPDEMVHSAIEKMQRYNVEHLPVIEAGRFVGLLRIRDLLFHQIDLQRREIQHLQEYIQLLQNAEHD
jgi:CBS domain-containing protein